MRGGGLHAKSPIGVRQPHAAAARRLTAQTCCRAAAAAAEAKADADAPRRKRSAIVVGGGIGGLVVAGRLARAGVAVTLLEQNEGVGGRCQSLQSDDGYRWDTGPSLLLFPGTYREAYEKLGSRLEAHVDLRRVEPAAYRVFFGPQRGGGKSGGGSGSGAGGVQGSGPREGAGSRQAGRGGDSGSGGGGGFTHLDLLYDVQVMREQLDAVEPGAGTEYISWLADARRALVVGTENFIARDVEGIFDLLDPSRLLPLLGQVDVVELLGQHHGRLARRFKDPRICALLSFQDLYVGLSPYNAPGVFSLLAATELTDGVYYPVGGFGTVRDSLLALAHGHGAEVRTRARVERFLVDEASGRVCGVQLAGGERLEADVVITNADVATSLGLFRGPGSGGGGEGGGGGEEEEAQGPAAARLRAHAARRRARLEEAEYSAGVIAFNWAVSRPSLGSLLHHNVFLSGDFAASWRRARRGSELPEHPNFYVHVPSVTDPTAAPEGCHSVMVLLPVANMQERRRAGGGDGGSSNGGSGASSGGGGGGDYVTGGAASLGDYRELVEAGRAAMLRTLREAGMGDLSAPGAISKEIVISPPEWRARYGLAQGAAFGLAHGLDQLSLLRPGPEDGQLPGLFFVGASARPGNGVPLCMMSGDMVAGRVLRALGVPDPAAVGAGPGAAE